MKSDNILSTNGYAIPTVHYMWMTIIYIPFPGLSTLAKEFTGATRVMEILSNELSTPVSGSAKCKQTKANTKYVIIPELT